MPLARFKDLIVDVNDPALMGPFWAETLGLELRHRERDDMTYLVGPTPQHTVWLNRVPEPVTAKQRVHLDVHVASTAEVLARGATPEDLESFRWDVLRDPEGGELCAFTREEVPAYRLYEIGVDSADAHAIARWWGELLGATVNEETDEGYTWLGPVPGMPFESLDFVPVPEPKTVKNRIHWDVDTTSIQALVEHGATVLREPDDEISWHVLADPEGNEFCAFLED